MCQREQLPYHNALNAGAMPEVLDIVLEVRSPPPDAAHEFVDTA